MPDVKAAIEINKTKGAVALRNISIRYRFLS